MGEYVVCSNCRSVLVDVDFEKHRCFQFDSMNRLVPISNKGRHPIEFKPEDFEKMNRKS
jgi:hypothetical protein